MGYGIAVVCWAGKRGFYVIFLFYCSNCDPFPNDRRWAISEVAVGNVISVTDFLQ